MKARYINKSGISEEDRRIMELQQTDTRRQFIAGAIDSLTRADMALARGDDAAATIALIAAADEVGCAKWTPLVREYRRNDEKV